MRYPDIDRTTADPIGTGGDVAIDIETINLVDHPDLDFECPEHWSIFAVAVGHRPAGSDTVETDVIFRRGPTICYELEMLKTTAEWIRDRAPNRILTYNGATYDIPILKHRECVAAQECPGDHSLSIRLILEPANHVDLFRQMKAKTGDENTSLDDALDQHGIMVEDIRLHGETVTGADMPRLGTKIVHGDASFDEHRAVADYAESDVRPLFGLFDALD